MMGRLFELGWTTTLSGAIPDKTLKKLDLLCIRGIIVDNIFLNNKKNRATVTKAREKLARKQNN